MTSWSGFPTRPITVPTELFRIHRQANGAAWFSSDGSGRFDPPAAYKGSFGTCYLGLTAIASYLETLGRFRAVTTETILDRTLSVLHVVRDIEVADLGSRPILGRFGVTAEHATGSNYELSQELAADLRAAGIDGVFYPIRHDPAVALHAVALFGEPGDHPERFQTNPRSTKGIPQEVVARGRDEFGIQVITSVPLA